MNEIVCYRITLQDERFNSLCAMFSLHYDLNQLTLHPFFK